MNRICNWQKDFNSADVDVSRFVLKNSIFLVYSDSDTFFRSVVLWDYKKAETYA